MTKTRWSNKLLQAFLLAAGLASANAAQAAPAPAQIVSLEGKGEYREAQQIDWRPAKVNQQLFPANLVRTGDASKMAVMFPDRTQVRLAPNSVLQIKDIAQGKEAKTVLNLNAGRSWMQSKTTPGGLNVETPSATASIRGTDWEIVVAPDGRSTLTVFSGEAEFSNAQGSVVVGRNEQAVAEQGKAPVKVQVVNPRERIQWVALTSVNPSRYREPDPAAQLVLDKAASELKDGRADLARATLADAIMTPVADSASARLLLADFQVFNGDLLRAAETLSAASVKFAGDARVPTAQARLAMLSDDAVSAAGFADRALQLNKQHADAWLLRGDLAKLQGNATDARAAYTQATTIAPSDARGWLGLGLVAAEREQFAEAQRLFDEAIKHEPGSMDVLAERATMETAAGDLIAARKSFESALAAQPDSVLLLTGKAILELKSGDHEAALDLLLRATLIEPRYARAQLYLAVAYARHERPDRAYPQLLRVSELDRNDPLPHFMASQMHVDALEPAAAIDEAREAVRLMPYLKSLNQLANNQAGGANLGSAMSFSGMESWARHMAQESTLPFWAGSHLFLADRYAGDYSRRSELMQGFLLDPAAFGASNRYQSLVETPGNYATLSMRANRSDDLKLTEPVVTLNGYALVPTPVSYFAEVIDTRIRPGNTALKADARTLTAALGVKPRWDLGLFVYANRLTADADIGTADATGLFQYVSGYNNRVDAGGHFAMDAQSQLWFKAGAGDERSTVSSRSSIFFPGGSLTRRDEFVTTPRAEDLALRFTRAWGDGREFSVGAEGARLRTTNAEVQDSFFYPPNSSVLLNTLDSNERDRSASLYTAARGQFGAWGLEGLLGSVTYRKNRDFHKTLASPPAAGDYRESYDLNRTDATLGTVYRLQPGRLVRFACQAWTRPASPGAISPVATAGIVVDDQLVFPGGKLSRCRGQVEWEATPTTFLSLSADVKRIDNLASLLDGVLNTRAGVANLDRLRTRQLPLPPKPDALEDVPVFSQAHVKSASMSLEKLLTRSLAARFYYAYTDSADQYEGYRGNHVPYLPRHLASMGATWTVAGRSYLNAQAVYRSQRFSDETNLASIPAGWDLQVRAVVELDRKHWALEAYALNLLKKDASDVFGVIATYRF